MVAHPPSLPFDVRRLPVKRHKRRRGQRGGIRQRLRCRRNSASLPGIILSLDLYRIKEELRVKTKVCFEYREQQIQTNYKLSSDELYLSHTQLYRV